MEEIITSHIIGGIRVERLLYLDPGTGRHINDSKHMNFYRKQMRVALRNCGVINPEDIREYIARYGYRALAESLKRDSQDVLDDIKASGLRGRGGAGFPTGTKWEIMMKQAMSMASYQFAMYGMQNVPEEHLTRYAEQLLSDRQQADRILEKVEDDIALTWVRKTATIENKSVSLEEMRELTK